MPSMAKSVTTLRRALAIVAGLFGIVTLFSGGRVLLGADPGYVVYRPLLVFNTAMGAAYLAAGGLAWFSARRGQLAAAAICALNLAMLAVTTYVFLGPLGVVARQSVAAMSFRTVVWLVLLAAFTWLAHRRGSDVPAPGPR